MDDRVVTGSSVVLDHLHDLERPLTSGVDGVKGLVVRVDGSVDRKILRLLNVEAEFLKTSKGDFLQHLPFGSDSDGPIPDTLRLSKEVTLQR
jgi:hypothetical protein